MAMANDDTINESLINESLPVKDIVFACGVCGKSLVINVLGAGLTITCPDCGAEQQVPLSDGVEVANPVVELNAVTAVADEQKVEHEFPEISDVLADAREQINALTLENDELQFRRQFLEKRHALVSQDLQALRRETVMIRKAMDQMDEILKTMEDPSASDTQPIA
jgi:transcription elongation factor Elf1